MSQIDGEFEKFKIDPRMPCQYGSKCYQKNPLHLEKYKHPPKRHNSETNVRPAKRLKVETDVGGPLKQSSDGEEDTMETVKKKECISASESDEECNEVESSHENIQETSIRDNKEIKHLDPKEFITSKFLVQFPTDFYSFWEYCKKINSKKPSEAFKDVGLTLIGPYDVLAKKFNNNEKPDDEYLLHWRYYYDPPELFTVLKGDDKTGYHIGYFFDSPNELPSILVSNHGTKDGVLTKMGDNIFAAVGTYLEEFKKTANPFIKMKVIKLLNSLKAEAENLKLSVSVNSQKIKDREKNVVAKTFNKIGLVVPYNKKTQLGYRDLAMTDKELLILLNKIDTASAEQRDKYLSDLQPVLTYANIALDECDFGTGVKLGWQLLFHGTNVLNSTISRFLSNSYKLLQKDAFAKIAEVHMNNRKSGCSLSII